MNSKCYVCSEQKSDSSSCCKHHIYDKATFMKIKLDSSVKKKEKKDNFQRTVKFKSYKNTDITAKALCM